MKDLKFYECSIIGCTHKTTIKRHSNPRLRWIIELRLQDDDGKEVILNLCPQHIRQQLPNADEDFFRRLENTENLIRREVIH